MNCDHLQTIDEAIERSSQIFVAEAREQRSVAVSTTHHGLSETFNVRFRVLQGWRNASVGDDVWIETSGMHLRCGNIEIGKTYLIYANQSSHGLFIHPDSRTMMIDGQSEIRDLERLIDEAPLGAELGFVWPAVITLTVIITLFLVVLLKKWRQSKVESRSIIFGAIVFSALLFGSCRNPEQNQLRFASAAVRGDKVTVSELLENGNVDINAQNGKLGPALVAAAYGGHTDVVKLLLEKGADINVRDDNGTTALMNAVIAKHPEVVKLLLENDANAGIENGKDESGNGITALTYARIRQDPQIIRMLEQVGDKETGK